MTYIYIHTHIYVHIRSPLPPLSDLHVQYTLKKKKSCLQQPLGQSQESTYGPHSLQYTYKPWDPAEAHYKLTSGFSSNKNTGLSFFPIMELDVASCAPVAWTIRHILPKRSYFLFQAFLLLTLYIFSLFSVTIWTLHTWPCLIHL